MKYLFFISPRQRNKKDKYLGQTYNSLTLLGISSGMTKSPALRQLTIPLTVQLHLAGHTLVDIDAWHLMGPVINLLSAEMKYNYWYKMWLIDII